MVTSVILVPLGFGRGVCAGLTRTAGDGRAGLVEFDVFGGRGDGAGGDRIEQGVVGCEDVGGRARRIILTGGGSAEGGLLAEVQFDGAILRNGDKAFEAELEGYGRTGDGEFDSLVYKFRRVAFEDGSGGKGGAVERAFRATGGLPD